MIQRQAVILSQFRLPGDAWEKLEAVEIQANLGAGGPIRPEILGLIVGGATVDAELLDHFPNLKVLARYGIGYDNVDVEECISRGVQVGITSGPVETATAELTIALILAARWNLLNDDKLTRAGKWAPPLEAIPHREQLDGSTLGLVGLGRVGERVARLATALGMQVLYHSRSKSITGAELALEYVSLEDLLARSDVVSLHIPLNRATKHFMDAGRLAQLRDGALLVNTARGQVVDEAALIQELNSGRISAALDVYENEPVVPAELKALPNVVLTPHIGSATRTTRIQMTRIAVSNVLAGLSGQPLPSPLDIASPKRAGGEAAHLPV